MIRRIPLSGGRHLLAGLKRARLETREWIVFLPESNSDFQAGHRRDLKRLIGTKLADRFNYLVINKPGQSAKRTDSMVFERSFRHSRRVADARTAIAAIVPQTDIIYLIGYSEGAYLAPQVASGDPRVQGVVMIGGGTRGWLKEEISNAKASDRAAVLRQIRDIQKHPRSRKMWNGFSYATWYSYRKDDTLRALRTLRVPMIAVLGGRDRTIDLKAALTDLRELRDLRDMGKPGKSSSKRPIEICLMKNCGHSFTGHWTAVGRALARFFKAR